MTDPSAGEIERATWLLDHSRPSEARDVLLRAAKTAQVPIAPVTLRLLLHRADVAQAVSGISRTGRLPRHASRALERLCGEPFDAWVGVGCAIHTSVLAVEGKAEAAGAELQRTFRTWVQAQGGAMKRSVSEDDIERDAMVIRDLLFEPDSFDGLRERSEPYAPPPFIFMQSSVRATTREGAQSHVFDARTPQGRSNVILLSGVEARTLWTTVEQLTACDQGGRRTRRLDRLWDAMLGFSKLYCTVGGSWYTAPTVDIIHFMNPERTRAHVVVTVGKHSDGGRVAVVEKVDGEWKRTGSAGVWLYSDLPVNALYAARCLMQAGRPCSSSSLSTRPTSPKSTRTWPRTSCS